LTLRLAAGEGQLGPIAGVKTLFATAIDMSPLLTQRTTLTMFGRVQMLICYHQQSLRRATFMLKYRSGDLPCAPTDSQDRCHCRFNANAAAKNILARLSAGRDQMESGRQSGQVAISDGHVSQQSETDIGRRGRTTMINMRDIARKYFNIIAPTMKRPAWLAKGQTGLPLRPDHRRMHQHRKAATSMTLK